MEMNETWMKWKSEKCPGVKKEQKPLNGNKNFKKVLGKILCTEI